MSNETNNLTTPATNADSGEVPFPRSRQPDEFTEYLCRAHAAGIEVDFRRADGKIWAMALDGLINNSRMDVARALAPRMTVAFPGATYFRTMATLFDRLPAPCDDPSFAAFRDDKTKEVQIVPRSGANCVLLAFCGRTQRIGMPIDLVHRWFGQLGVHVIYLRDYEGHNYDQGIRSLSSDMASTLQALREIIAGLRVSRIVCYGNSLGSYGALRYALELEAEAALAFAAPTNLLPNFGNFIDKQNAESGIDLRPLYQNKSYPPRVHLMYGEHHPFDRAQAINFRGLPTVTLEMAPGWNHHDVFLHAMFVGRYEPLLQWLVDPNRAAGRP
jgi:pimeloyl-ACP methyl ester carboxylesterase